MSKENKYEKAQQQVPLKKGLGEMISHQDNSAFSTLLNQLNVNQSSGSADNSNNDKRSK